MMELLCDFHYDAAHYLPHVPSGHKCGQLHGHTYVLTVSISGPVRDDGFVLDFAEVKDDVEPLISELDHRLLNDVIENPTVENQLVWFWDKLSIPVTALTLREGLANAATYRGTHVCESRGVHP